MSMSSLIMPFDGVTRSISAENPTGEKGMGGRALHGDGEECARRMGRGQGWKICPNMHYEPGETITIADIEGPGMIRSMWFGGAMGRDYILRMYWDEEEYPSVVCPLPEFFAYGWLKYDCQENSGPISAPFFPIISEPVVVNPNHGMNCFWLMPFRKHAKITLENRGDKSASIFFQINYTLNTVPEDALYFHAQFRMKTLQPYECYTLLDRVHGRGNYVGTAMFVGLNGSGNWWGEGEFKFYLDGDTDFPTICGTGTEDYFGGAYDWEVDGQYQTYTTPYMGMHQYIAPTDINDCQKRFSMYRWHMKDPISFSRDIRVTVQDLGWNRGRQWLPRRDDFASVVYWYQDACVNDYEPLPDADMMLLV